LGLDAASTPEESLFVARVQQVPKPDDTLLVMCRSGGRGAALLAGVHAALLP